jgi:hypothetical protein
MFEMVLDKDHQTSKKFGIGPLAENKSRARTCPDYSHCKKSTKRNTKRATTGFSLSFIDAIKDIVHPPFKFSGEARRAGAAPAAAP